MVDHVALQLVDEVVAAFVLVLALLAAGAAGVLARLDGATYPSALMRAAATFAAVVTLATAIAGVLTQILA
ncbi:hypothetical protein [Streptomyces subrutilus]|uniref:Uncharacterized protein n=1 Tax=Streptomyces subrutilus TaxID=36818 RepID=A0A1E5PZV6_9ACTN|nr:hypothetical protein [Streptomyces subrutilus]OEJ35178.1 hypothetical protein BGK67_31145 [Streptomyces subrutilus]